MKNSLIIYDTYVGETSFPKDADVALITVSNKVLVFPATRLTGVARFKQIMQEIRIRVSGAYYSWFYEGQYSEWL